MPLEDTDGVIERTGIAYRGLPALGPRTMQIVDEGSAHGSVLGGFTSTIEALQQVGKTQGEHVGLRERMKQESRGSQHDANSPLEDVFDLFVVEVMGGRSDDSCKTPRHDPPDRFSALEKIVQLQRITHCVEGEQHTSACPAAFPRPAKP